MHYKILLQKQKRCVVTKHIQTKYRWQALSNFHYLN